ncbi:MAG: hypothetical protein CME65_12930 [Halobacteriovoraceae bacterium]|nr:hypothetical protein [Halobacteriovoraceae bacterium]|tara:strand:+ start:7222 stop:7746 length:525 start_codon:yes stop_codon:yes gene_type:complete
MSKFLSLILILSSLGAVAKNRPYTDVVAELNPNSCPVKKENLFLTKKQRALIEKKSETKVYGGLALRYVIRCKDVEPIFLYVDSHIVRTLNETVVIKIEDGKVSEYEVASFNEPPEYIAPKKWLEQFKGKKPGKALRVIDDIDGLSGATLTAGSSVSAVNKILALHEVTSSKNK